ncbi:MAG: hypothetical protein PHS48_02535 [Bacteroidales bacterium]|nr:hypothetical protein [Bacteroidales bacterium]
MKTKILLLAMVFTFGSVTSSLKAQEKVKADARVDLVSSYVWRGLYQTGASIQPTLAFAYSGFNLTAWGSTDFKLFKEFDLTLGYTTGGLTLSVTDYWWAGQGQRYFDYDLHYFEGTAAYYMGESFPMTLSWSTIFSGEGDKDASGDQMYSSYLEAGYDFTVGEIALHPAVGIVPWGPSLFHIQSTRPEDMQMTNISLKASKNIKVTDAYTIPAFAQVVVSPYDDNIHFVFGMTF